MTNRKLRELGIHPVLAYGLGIVGFALLSEFTFHKTEFAKYIVLLTALSSMVSMSETKRSEFLIIVFGTEKSRRIRMIENAGISLPFVMVLLYHKLFPEAILLFISSLGFASISFKNKFTATLPTPFYKRPFEFTVGFRKTFFIFPLAYILTAIGISVNNLNLGIFALLLVFLIAITYYIKPEHEYYVWSHSANPPRFILEKIKTATLYVTGLVLPIVISLLVFDPNHMLPKLIFTLIGYAFLWTIILAKYAAYPMEINLPEGILLAICIYFPPLLLALIPYFYRKSIINLNVLLK